jgi:hypothetical protein
LNEYTERKEMPGDIVCMALGSVPEGEQRSRFLAVGLSDSTVRIISLDPQVSELNFINKKQPDLFSFVGLSKSIEYASSSSSS